MSGEPITQPDRNDGATLPPITGKPALFRVMYEAVLQSVGEPPRPGSGRLRIEITPTQMILLQEELTPRAIVALMLVLEHGYRPGKRIEIEGWSARWLIEKGMPRTTAEKAAAELRDKGYIRSDRLPGATSPLGRKLGVVPSGVVEEVEDVPGIPRTDGRPATKEREPAAKVPLLKSTVSAEHGNRSIPVDNSVSGGSRNGVSLERRNSDPTDEFPQVRAVSGLGPERDIHSPTSSDSSEEGLFFLPGQGQALTRADLTRFFAQPSLVEAVGSCWDVTVALLAREFSANAQRCAELVDWLGDGQDAHPDLRLAQIVADILKTHPLQRLGAASHQEAYLRTRGVKFRQSTPDEFIAAFVVTIITALDSRPIENWGGWFGAGLKREEQFQGGKVLTGCLAVFRGLLEDPEGLVASASEEPERKGSTFDEHDVDYIARLRAAALGTVWEDEIDFQKLLRNPAQQAKILFAYGRRTGSSDH